MAPRAPQVVLHVRRGPKTHGTTTRHKARAAGFATQLASPPDPYNTPSSPGAVGANLELLRHGELNESSCQEHCPRKQLRGRLHAGMLVRCCCGPFALGSAMLMVPHSHMP